MPAERALAALAAASVVALVLGPTAPVPLRRGRAVVCAGVVASTGLLLVVARASLVPLPLLAAGLGVGLALAREVRRRRQRIATKLRRDSAITACTGLVAELQAGLPPVSALHAVAADWPELRTVAEAAVLGADVPAAMRHVAALPGAAALRWVAAAWTVAHRSGAGLAAAIELATEAMAEERATARVLETELSSARATARLLAVLPFGVLLIGSGAGGDPFGFLFGTPAGTACLVGGLALAWTGLWWIERIAVGIEGA